MRHLVRSTDLGAAEWGDVLRRFDAFIDGGIRSDLCRGKVVGTFFFQPSTRTMLCFQSALLRAGGGYVGVSGGTGLSIDKGEDLEDTVRECSSFADALVLRHPDPTAAERAARASSVPVLNAGCGSSEHAVAVAMMLCSLKHGAARPLDEMAVGFYGAPSESRVAKSLLPILGHFGVRVLVDDLGLFPFPPEVVATARANGAREIASAKLDEFVPAVDLLIVTGMSLSGVDASPEKEAALREARRVFRPIGRSDVARMKQDATLQMIKPRVSEIGREVDSDHRAKYARPEPFTEAALALFTHLVGIPV